MYNFPYITCINDVLPAIAGKEEFIVAEKSGYKVVNYLVAFENTFEDPLEPNITEQESLYRAIRRECRGIIFDSKNGQILSRRFNKFFNLNEKPETHTSKIDISKPHVITDKLDGSFVAPFLVDDQLVYGTKMGWTEQTNLVHEFVKNKPRYDNMSRRLIELCYTPIFEFTSPLNRIVIPYKETNLTLLAVRKMYSGEYMSYADMKEMCKQYDIPLVKALSGSIENMDKFVSDARALSGKEGYVIRFDDGMAIKLKADEYVLKHKVKDSISQEKNLVELIFTDKMDDVYSTLDKEDADKVKQYADSVLHTVTNIVQKVNQIVSEQKPLLNNEKKRFALEIIPQYKEYSGVLFAVWDGKDALETIKKQVLNNCATQTKVNTIRQFLGPLIWADIYSSVVSD